MQWQATVELPGLLEVFAVGGLCWSNEEIRNATSEANVANNTLVHTIVSSALNAMPATMSSIQYGGSSRAQGDPVSPQFDFNEGSR